MGDRARHAADAQAALFDQRDHGQQEVHVAGDAVQTTPGELMQELQRAVRLAGRRRQFGSAGERARVAVRKAITAALARIERHDPALARLLRDTVRTGATCRYDPDPARPVSWRLDLPRPSAAPAAADPVSGRDMS